MIRWFDDRTSYESATREAEPARKVIETHFCGVARSEGYCCACQRIVEFAVGPQAKGDWLNLRESFLCGACGLNGRARSLLLVLRAEIGESRPATLVFEHVTPLFRRVRTEFPFVQSCEFLGPDLRSGEVKDQGGQRIRHEDMMNLSYADESLDIVLHGDVLEHVPDFRAGLRECARALRVGGVLLFSAPFYRLEQHLVRAQVVGGRLVHHLKPAYHGNPLSSEGSLVFTHFGWPLLDDVREAGFRSVEIGLLYDPYQGIVSNNNPYDEGHMWPVLFRARK